MPFKLNISEKGKAWKLEIESESLIGKSIGDKISGKDIKPELEGYELQITGGSDLAGFPHSTNVEGLGLKRVLLTKGFAMRDNYPGIRRKKTVRGKQLSESSSQINLSVLKSGAKKLAEIFPDQNKPAEAKPKPAPVAAA
jgi:small subunit ribosomal protein S6e